MLDPTQLLRILGWMSITQILGSTIDTKSKRQGSVSNSTGAAELNAIALAVRKAAIYFIVFKKLGYSVGTVTIKTDSRDVRGHAQAWPPSHLRPTSTTPWPSMRSTSRSLPAAFAWFMSLAWTTPPMSSPRHAQYL